MTEFLADMYSHGKRLEEIDRLKQQLADERHSRDADAIAYDSLRHERDELQKQLEAVERERDHYRRILERIAHPVKALLDDANSNGNTLDGYNACVLAGNAMMLREWAEQGLKRTTHD